MASFQPNEKEFLRRFIKGVYYLRTTDKDINFNQNPANYEGLFNDLVVALKIPKSCLGKESFDDPKQGYKANWRTLQRFFTETRTGIENSVMKTLYAYATHGRLNQEEVREATRYGT
mgnify:FL=1